ncbi:MAG TPA: glycosyltransferase [Azospirillaceae bacterium]|nr:glycosyltransferase [Azospirillaceae bacterium]
MPAAAPPRVAAAIVTFQPPPRLASAVAAIVPQVERLYLLDNGSDPDGQARAEQAASAAGAVRLAGEGNAGLAAAQNRLMEAAARDGFDWVLLLDQDSVARPGAVAALLRALADAPAPDALGLLAAVNLEPGMAAGPAWVVSADGRAWRVARPGEGRALLADLLFAPASGSLVRVEAWRRAGGLRAGFFIDWVDVEFCVRLRRAGYGLAAVADALVDHELGALRAVRAGSRELAVTNHAAWRRRMQARNAVWTLRLHGAAVPALRSWTLRILASTAAKVLLFERGRLRKLAAMAAGLAEGLRRPPD